MTVFLPEDRSKWKRKRAENGDVEKLSILQAHNALPIQCTGVTTKGGKVQTTSDCSQGLFFEGELLADFREAQIVPADTAFNKGFFLRGFTDTQDPSPCTLKSLEI